jgi:hypothetical protein
MLASVTLLAFGRKGYAFAAANLIASLRHYGFGGDINLLVDDRCRTVLPDWVHPMASVKMLPADIGNNPCDIKLQLPQLIDGPTLYLDVDGVVLKNITPWIEALQKDGRAYITEVKGKGKEGETIQYFEWATPAKCREKHDLPDTAIFYGLQSSWAFMRPGLFLDEIYINANAMYKKWALTDLKHKWGTTFPDELFFSLACTVMGHDPSWTDTPMFFGKGFDSLPQVRDKYYILSLWGSGRGKGSVPPRHVEKYDAVMRQVMTAKGRPHDLKSNFIREDKFVDQKPR